MIKCIKELSAAQVITFFAGFLLMVFAIYFISKDADTVTVFSMGFGVILIIVSAVDPNTLKDFIWSQDENGQKLTFNRHISTPKEIEDTIKYTYKAESFKLDDLENNLLIQDALNRGIRERSDVDFLLIATKHWRTKEYEKSLRAVYMGLTICENKRIKSLLEMRLGSVFSDMEQISLALTNYEKAIEIDPNNSIAYNNLGILLKEKGELEKSEHMYKKVIALDPSFSAAYNNLGILLKEKGNLEEARRMYEKAIETDPNYAGNYNNYGVLLKEKGNLEEAERMYEKAIEIDSSYRKPYHNLAILLKNKGKIEKANRMLKKAKELEE